MKDTALKGVIMVFSFHHARCVLLEREAHYTSDILVRMLSLDSFLSYMDFLVIHQEFGWGVFVTRIQIWFC